MEIILPELHLLNGLVIWVVEFSREGYKIKRIFGQKSISSKEIIVFCVLCRVVKVPKSDIQSQINGIFLIYFSFDLGTLFCKMHPCPNFCDTLFSKLMPNL